MGGDLALKKGGSPFCDEIMVEIVPMNFQLPDLLKYDGSRDPQKHLTAFKHVMQLYGKFDTVNARIHITTLAGRAQEWFTTLLADTVVSSDQLCRKFTNLQARRRPRNPPPTCSIYDIGKGNHSRTL